MDPFVIKQNDTMPYLEATLSDDNGPVDLTGASVKLAMKPLARCGQTSALKFKKAGVVVTPASGVVRYQWGAGDTDTAGNFQAEFEVTFADGGVRTFPSTGYIPVTVTPELG
jgi:hypothetical protein